MTWDEADEAARVVQFDKATHRINHAESNGSAWTVEQWEKWWSAELRKQETDRKRARRQFLGISIKD